MSELDGTCQAKLRPPSAQGIFRLMELVHKVLHDRWFAEDNKGALNACCFGFTCTDEVGIVLALHSCQPDPGTGQQVEEPDCRHEAELGHASGQRQCNAGCAM